MKRSEYDLGEVLLDLHKRVLETHLRAQGVKLHGRKKFFQLYDMFIDEKNVRTIFFRPIALFTKALVKNQLSDIADIYPEPEKKRRRKDV